MLVLSRKKEQSIIVGDLVEIRVLAIHSDRVFLGIKAPKEVPVHRKEVFLMLKEKEDAETPNP